MSDDHDLDELSGKLAALDIDPARADAIAAAARHDLRHGRSPRRFVEPVLVALLVASFLAWAIWRTFF